jgi:ribose 1,5-bisphosphokinase PhnN
MASIGGPASLHEGFLKHRRMRWARIAAALCLVAILIYVLVDKDPRPMGGTWYGYTLGTVSALLVVWLALLGIRKRAITSGAWSLKAWTSAHVYLGLSLVVLATLHAGFDLGWNVHSLAYGLMMLVILSGLYGVVAYANLPQALSDNRRNKTQEQMIEAIAAIDRQLDQASQQLGRERADLILGVLEQDVFHSGVWRRITGRHPHCATGRALDALASAEGAEIERIRALLAMRQGQLRQIREHMRLRALLDVWLTIHVPATIALLAALAAHIVSVFYYW